MSDVTAYLCSKNVGTAEVTFGKKAINVFESQVEVFMVPGSSPNWSENEVGVTLLKADQDPYKDRPIFGVPVFIEPNPDNYPAHKIFFNNPSDQCQWKRTSVVVFGPGALTNPEQFKESIMVQTGQRTIPEQYDDIIVPNGPFEHVLDDNRIVPGAKVSIEWEYFNGSETIIVNDLDEAFQFWSTPHITGGVIKSINGNYGDEFLTYTVEYEGQEIECRPSDFIEWEVGDWVYVARLFGVIIPIQVNGKGA